MPTADFSSPRPGSFQGRPKDPKRIGQWKLGRTIGQGGQGRVRLARNGRTGQMAAVKIMNKSMLHMRSFDLQHAAEEEERVERGRRREVVAMKLINHPNIMRLYEVWDTPDELYLILEYIQGGELFDFLIEHGKLEPMEALKYFQQIIFAMDYCHRFNIAHRDLKPENILMDADHNIKIADFGLSAWTIGDLLATSCGSPHYAAPEILRGQPYDGPSIDVWSCGVILFALLTGTVPWDDDEKMSVTENVIYSPARFTKIEHLQARDLVQKMLIKDPTKRFTMEQVMKHPYFTAVPSASAHLLPPSLDEIAHPVDRGAINDSLLDGLRCMWNESDQSLIEQLTNEEKNWQKGIYFLLSQYRQQTIKQFEEDEQLAQESRAKRIEAKRAAREALRRTKSVGDIAPSLSFLPPRGGPPTPRRAARGGTLSTSSSDSSDSSRSSQSWIQLTPMAAKRYEDTTIRSPPISTDPIGAFMKEIDGKFEPLPKPLAISPILSFMADASETHRHDEEDDADLSALGLKVRPLNVAKFKPRPRRSTIDAILAQGGFGDSDSGGEDVEGIEDGYLVVDMIPPVKPPPRKIIDIFVRGMTKPAISQPKRAQSLLQRNKFKRRGHSHSPVLQSTPARASLSPFSPPPSPSPPSRKWVPPLPSPAVALNQSSSPPKFKKRRLAELLKLKPSAVRIFSTRDVGTTRNECRRLLMGMGVLVAVNHKNKSAEPGVVVLKCRLEELKDLASITDVVLKAVKFRVQIYPSASKEEKKGEDNNTVGSLAVFVHEGGSVDSLKVICSRIKEEWVLDRVGTMTPEQVALKSPGPVKNVGFFAR